MTLSPLQWPEAALTIGRTFGVRGGFLRAMHEARKRTSSFRARPRHTPGAGGDAAHIFRVDAPTLANSVDRTTALERADRVCGGEYQAYRWTWCQLPATPDAWHRHPSTARLWRADGPWWNASHLDPIAGDVKDLWEPARFAWAYDLTRGYLLTGDDRYARALHEHLARWIESSPPFQGVHWSCGQETAIRAIALLYVEANMAGAPSSTPAAMARLESVLAASGERIADAIGYAISQRNNHAISEAAGLIALGARFRAVHPEAEHWFAEGRRLLERLIIEQFAEDGWYIQHSFTYARLALDQCVIAARVLREAGEELSRAARARLGAALDLLLAVLEPNTGTVPNHGPNDGAFVHPVTLAAYRDFRPLVTAVCGTLRRPVPSNVALDREVLVWLGLPAPASGPPLADAVVSGPSGWVAVRSGTTSVFLRAGHYRSRPGHIDALQLDVRMDDREVIVDPGTFAYNAPFPWRNGLAGAAAHNGPMLDDRDPGVRGPRFLWYLWPAAQVTRVTPGKADTTLVAEIPGRVRRTVRVAQSRVEVEDEVLATDARNVHVRWLLHPDADPALVEVHGGAELRTAAEETTAGWFSPSYGVRLASRYVDVSRTAQPGHSIITTVTTR